MHWSKQWRRTGSQNIQQWFEPSTVSSSVVHIPTLQYNAESGGFRFSEIELGVVSAAS